MFTDRFIKVPIDLYNNKEADMVGYNADTRFCSTYCMLNPFEIAFYRPAVDDNEGMSKTLVHFKSGERFEVSLSVKEFENLLNHFSER